MTPHRALALAALLALLPASSGFAAGSVKLTAAHCLPSTGNHSAALPQAFGPYLPFTRLCRVPNAVPALWVAVVWVNEYVASQPASPQDEDIPRPVLISADGKVLGTLPAHYPDEDAMSTFISFSQYRRGWPHRVDVTATTLGVGDAPQFEPMTWDAAAQQFRAAR